ncbi:AMP-dependent synthetase [Frankia sp. B2]|uniref:AMP-binding protein n=1 Tax=Frankia sp. B2 TaxID=2541730 RepID=UPI0010693B01|nr:AMP-binding protein [Frankia sp. B2]TFE25305.1 AMP-dependent synthetase [Frankia sp. B2]
MTSTAATETYRTARDLLINLRTDYGKALEEFRWPRFEGQFNWAIDWFDPIARNNDRVALWIVEEDGSERRCTYDEMARRSDRVATWLAGLGIGKGDPVILMLGNQVELWESMLALMKLGAVIIPTTTAISPTDLADRIERGGATCVIANAADAVKVKLKNLNGVIVGGEAAGWRPYTEADGVTEVHRFESRTAPTDPLLFYFTSGTTSRPKLVEHSQVSYPVGHLSTLYWTGVQPGDVHLNISSPGWAKHAWSSFFVPLIAEATIFVYNYGTFDPAKLLAQLRRAGVTTMCAPPTVWRMLIKVDLSGGPGALREVLSAGEPLNPEVIDQVRAHWGLTLRDGFGQTETTAQVGNSPGAAVKPGSMGRPLPGVPTVLVDPVSGQHSSTEGELCLDLAAHPLALMTSYRGDPERNAEVLAGGYYHTGDVASLDEDGYLTYIGRTDDVFKASDYKVSPFELESVLVEHPAVLEAAVVPAPDEVRLAVPKAYIALAPGWEPNRETAEAILRHARENLAPYLRVRRLEFYDLPKTISGKIRRVELRSRESEAAGTRLSMEYRDTDFPRLTSRKAD